MSPIKPIITTAFRWNNEPSGGTMSPLKPIITTATHTHTQPQTDKHEQYLPELRWRRLAGSVPPPQFQLKKTELRWRQPSGQGRMGPSMEIVSSVLPALIQVSQLRTNSSLLATLPSRGTIATDRFSRSCFLVSDLPSLIPPLPFALSNCRLVKS